jgi:hypothetical protein
MDIDEDDEDRLVRIWKISLDVIKHHASQLLDAKGFAGRYIIGRDIESHIDKRQMVSTFLIDGTVKIEFYQPFCEFRREGPYTKNGTVSTPYSYKQFNRTNITQVFNNAIDEIIYRTSPEYARLKQEERERSERKKIVLAQVAASLAVFKDEIDALVNKVRRHGELLANENGLPVDYDIYQKLKGELSTQVRMSNAWSIE